MLTENISIDSYRRLYMNLFNGCYTSMCKKYTNSPGVETIINNLNNMKHELIEIGEKYNLNP